MPDLSWRTEDACRAAWPAVVETVIGGWLLRCSGGSVRRTNSANPLRGKRDISVATIDGIEAFYAARRQAPMFRVPTIAGEVGAELDRRGYAAEGETIHLFASIDAAVSTGGRDVFLSERPDEDWLRSKARISSLGEADMGALRRMVRLIRGRKAFVWASIDGAIVAVAYGVVAEELLVVEAVATDPSFRGRGFGRRTVGTLIDWAHSAGARAACLQVEAGNMPARALYSSLGFDRELHRYHYRRGSQPG
jgi:GNAT superfamily N-acetyltransferase